MWGRLIAAALLGRVFLRRRDRLHASGRVLDEAMQLVRSQLLMQIEDDGSLDVRATGIVGFNGALVAATIAAKNVLGHYWYTPLFGLGLSTLILLASLVWGFSRLLPRARGFAGAPATG